MRGPDASTGAVTSWAWNFGDGETSTEQNPTHTYDDLTGDTYTVTLGPNGEGKNGIPTGKLFYAILHAYVPVAGADMTVKVKTR